MARQRNKWSGRSYAARASPEQTAALQGQDIFIRSLRSRAPGTSTDSRIEQSRHQQGAVHVAVTVLGNQAAQASVHVKRRCSTSAEVPGKDDSEPVPYDHEIARLLRRPNRKETGGMIR